MARKTPALHGKCQKNPFFNPPLTELYSVHFYLPAPLGVGI